jgi:hypothetical protein
MRRAYFDHSADCLRDVDSGDKLAYALGIPGYVAWVEVNPEQNRQGRHIHETPRAALMACVKPLRLSVPWAPIAPPPGLSEIEGISPGAQLLLQNVEELAILSRIFSAGLSETSFPACRDLLETDCRRLANRIIQRIPPAPLEPWPNL